jgi:L-galactose dehydrogenase
MEYRRLGNTDLDVSLLGFGASTFGDAYQLTDPIERIDAVHLAIDSGINFFDVSPYYGITLAEERLGQALAGRRDKVILATKCGRYGLDDFDFSAQRVAASIDESLSRLKTDYVDLFQVHDVEFGNFRQVVEETIPALREIQRLGKARYIGVTGYSLGMLSRIIQSTSVDSVLTYCRYNLMNTDMDEVLTPTARKGCVGLINASGLNMGILTEYGAPNWHPAPTKVRDAGKQAVELCKKRGVSAARVALRFCFDHPYVSSTLVGMSTRSQVETNLEALRAATDLELQSELQHILKPVLNYVWPSGKPDNFDPKTNLS